MIRSYRIAKKNLQSHRLRTFLTVLGVAIGVFIVTLVLLVAGGLKQSLSSQAATLNGRIIVVRNSFSDATGMNAFSPLAVTPATTLTDLDAKAIAKTGGVQTSAAMAFISGEVSGTQNDYHGTDIVATNNNFPKVFNLEFISGGFFDENDLHGNEVVLGDKLAIGLFGTDQATGQIVTIKGTNFIVDGVIKPINQPISLAGVDIDKTAFIPAKQTTVFNIGSQIGQIVALSSSSQTAYVVRNISSSLAKNHTDTSEYTIQTGHKAANILSGWLLTLTSAALIFATISLVVGGIGIMNIMFVSAMERTREIGIRKAVGATQYNIFTQFLMEATLITFYGALAGLILAYLIGYIIALNFSLPLVLDPTILLIGLGIPVVVALVFGTWPAVRAARQNPIQALRTPN